MLCSCRQVVAEFLGLPDPCLRLARLLIRFIGELPRLAVGLLGRGARGLSSLVRQPLCLGERLSSVLDEPLGVFLGVLGVNLRILDLLVDLVLDLLPLLCRIRLGSLALAPYELVGGLLSLCNALLDLPTRLALPLGHSGTTTLADLLSVSSASLGLPRCFQGALFGLSSALGGLLCTPRPDLDRVPAEGSGVRHRGRYSPPPVASARRSRSGNVPDCLGGLQGLGKQPDGIGWHLTQTSSHLLQQQHQPLCSSRLQYSRLSPPGALKTSGDAAQAVGPLPRACGCGAFPGCTSSPFGDRRAELWTGAVVAASQLARLHPTQDALIAHMRQGGVLKRLVPAAGSSNAHARRRGPAPGLT